MKTQTLDELMGKITPLPWLSEEFIIYGLSKPDGLFRTGVANLAFGQQKSFKEAKSNTSYIKHATKNFPKLVEVGKGNLDFMKSLRNYFVNMKRQTTVLIDHEIENLEAALAAANEIKE